MGIINYPLFRITTFLIFLVILLFGFLGIWLLPLLSIFLHPHIVVVFNIGFYFVVLVYGSLYLI